MPKRYRTRQHLDELGQSIVDRATRENPRDEPKEQKPEDTGKDPPGVSLGLRAGLKGGPARAARLTAGKRRESAKKDAAAR